MYSNKLLRYVILLCFFSITRFFWHILVYKLAFLRLLNYIYFDLILGVCGTELLCGINIFECRFFFVKLVPSRVIKY